ncbi:uncharacterized protein LOC141863136 [Acropora palmata]|uniref:uncharacterized protein LOC141863136 n=1 Tax=Acropora palmata TaxID=6131 RepID=UPI003D9FB876
MPKSGDPELRASEQKPESRFNPNARESQSLPFPSSAAPAHNVLGDSMWSQQFMEKVAVTIKQGFALPQKELTVFNSDPLEYWSFITSFQNSIEANATSESEKLTYLLQYTSGTAKDTIKCCLVMDPSIGYQRARMLLEERFGQPFTIAYEHVIKLTHGPPLRATDRKGLLAFADQLKSCEHTLESIGYLDEVNSADNLRIIVMRLPFHLRTKLVEVADQIQQSGQRPNISHIAEFVKVKARAANNPVFGCLMDTERERTDNLRRRPKTRKPLFPNERGTAFNTRETELRESSSYSPNSEFPSTKYQKCPVCSAAHPLVRCHIFAEKPYEERLQVMRKAQLCHNCFKYGHIAVGCLAKKACDVQGCRRKHHPLLHPPSQPANRSTTGVSDQEVQLESGTALQTNSSSAKVGRVCLRIVPVRVRRNDLSKTVETYALLDTGSDVSLCDKNLATELGIQGQQKVFFLTTQERENSPRFGTEISLTVESLDGTDKIEVNRLWTVDRLNASSRSIPSELDTKQWPHLADLSLPSIEEREDRLIIGTNTPEAFWVLEERRGGKGEPYAIRTPLGWALIGPMTNVQDDLRHPTVNFVRSTEVMKDTQDLLMQQIERFWATETIGVETESKACMSLEDKKALRNMEQSVKLQDGHYKVALPWREFPPFLPYNRSFAERRLRMLKRRFLQDNELFKNYKGTMEKYLADGHARRVPPEELHVKNRPLWCLPHHHVLNKPGKTRVVFDCEAKYRGTSLNDQLLTGPDLTNSILGVLTRFREDRVALSADIECMFHQIRVSPADRDAFRFLWWPTGDLNQEAVDHRMEVHLFGATSSPSCSGFALRKTAEDNKEDFEEEVVKTVKRNFYVDDCLKSVKSVDCAIQIVLQLRNFLSKGGFRLTKWLSNNSKVLNFIPHEERAPSLLDLDLDKDKPPIQRALGLHWNMDADMFTFKVNLKEKPNTRRGILSLTSSLYDPLGLVAPIILPAKKLLQDLCKQKLGWDDPIHDDDKERWEKWKNQLSELPKITVSRCFRPIGFGELKLVELHSFADASQVAYGAVCYLRLVDVNGRMHCAFLVGRSRLAHVRPMTVPRLELCAAVLAVQLKQSIKEELDIPVTKATFWSDSTCVLQYIKNQSRRFHTFVANRLSIIHELSTPYQWRHVPSELSPADEVSRGITVRDMINNSK